MKSALLKFFIISVCQLKDVQLKIKVGIVYFVVKIHVLKWNKVILQFYFFISINIIYVYSPVPNKHRPAFIKIDNKITNLLLLHTPAIITHPCNYYTPLHLEPSVRF